MCLQSVGIIHQTFLSSHSAFTIVKLYVSLVQSQLLYCTQIWCPCTLNERYLNHWMCPVPCHQVHSYSMITPAVIKLDWSNQNYFPWCTCLNYITFYLLLNLLRHLPFSSTSPITSTSVLPVLDLVQTINSYCLII